MRKLFDAVDANDETTDNSFLSDGGTALVHAFAADGSWDGTETITVYMSLNGVANGKAIPDLVFIDDDVVLIQVPPEATVWATVTGSTGANNLSLHIAGI